MFFDILRDNGSDSNRETMEVLQYVLELFSVSSFW